MLSAHLFLALAPLALGSISPAWESAVAGAPAACSADCSTPAIQCSVSNCAEGSDGMSVMCSQDGMLAVEACSLCLFNEKALSNDVELDVVDGVLSSCLGPSYTTLDWSTSVVNAGEIITNGLARPTGSGSGSSSARPTTNAGNIDTRPAGDGEGDYYTRTPEGASASASSRTSAAPASPSATGAPGGGAGALGVSWVLAVVGVAGAALV